MATLIPGGGVYSRTENRVDSPAKLLHQPSLPRSTLRGLEMPPDPKFVFDV